jgi:periplasmic protein TonB
MGTRAEEGQMSPAAASTQRALLLSPFGALIAEIREEAGRPGSLAARRVAPPQAPFVTGREPDLRIETRVVSDPVATRSLSSSWLWPVSLALHAGLLLAAVVGPLFLSEPLPAPEHAVRAFFVNPATIAPPPPAPPALVQARTAPRSSPNAQALRPTPPRVAPAVRRPDSTAQRVDSAPQPADPSSSATESHVGAASIATLDQIGPETVDRAAAGGEPRGVAGGSAGGVHGGFPGGAAGGVIGGLPTPTPTTEPIRVGGEITEPKKLKHVDPVYPDIAVRANVQGTVVLECTVSPQGGVMTVKIVRGIPLLNTAAVAAVKQWVYTPTLRDGAPIPVILTVTVQFGIEERRRSTLGQPASVWAAIPHVELLL